MANESGDLKLLGNFRKLTDLVSAGDLPLSFYDEQPFKVEVSEHLLKVNQELAEQNLNVAERKFDVMLIALMEYMFEAAKQNAMKSPEQAREMDDLIRSIFHDQPSAMTLWEAFIQTCEIADEEIEDTWPKTN